MARRIFDRALPAAFAALSAAACASVEPPRSYAETPGPAPAILAAPVRANAPIPNPPERRAARGAGKRAAESAATEAVTRALGIYKVGKPYKVAGVWYVPAEQPDYDAVGSASWYGDAFHGKPTANGEAFDMHLASAAHATLPLPSIVEVTNLENNRSVQVRVNDRGPFKPGRIIDVSRAAAEELGFRSQGLAKVRVRYVGRAPLDPFLPTPPARPGSERPILLASLTSKPERRPEAAPEAKLASKPAPKALVVSAPEPVPAPILVAFSGGFAVQAGSFANKGNAERAARTLGAIAPAQVREQQREGAPLYRVLVGAWPARDGAAGALAAVAGAGFPDARIVAGS